MNKLYIIKFMLSNDYVVSVWYAWNADELKNKIAANPEWNFNMVENNHIHMIYEAR